MFATRPLSRRALLGSTAALGAAALVRSPLGAAEVEPLLTRPIPSTGEHLPLVGLGSWITFNVGDDSEARDGCAEVRLPAYFEALTRAEDRTVQVTPVLSEEGTCSSLGASAVRAGRFIVRALDGGRVGRDPFSRRGRNRRLDLRQGRLCSAT